MKKYKLGELIEVTRGTSLSGNYYATSGDYIRLTCGNFDYRNNCFKENSSKDNIYYIGEFKSDFLLNEGDIITPLTEQAIGLLGSTAWIPESGKYIQSQDIGKIICKEKLLDKKFAYYLLSSKEVKKQLSAGAQQTKIRHTSPSKIKNCIVWIPSLYEQKNIGEILFNIDRKIALNRAINHNLAAMAKQLYDYWFVQFDFPNEDGKPYKSSGGKMVWNEKLKREIPEGWEISNLDNIGNFKNGINYSKEDIGNNKYKIVNVRNISSSSIFIDNNELDEMDFDLLDILGVTEQKVESITLLPGYNKKGEKEGYEELVIKAGEIVAIVGPTGSGKSRLLADIEWGAQGDTPTKRTVLVNGELMDAKKRFSPSYKLVAQLSQNMNFVMDLTVRE